jgi:hypothetical protein
MINEMLVDRTDLVGEVILRDSADKTLLRSEYSLAARSNSALFIENIRWQVPTYEGAYALSLTLRDQQGAEIVQHTYRILARASYSIPLADPQVARRQWSWYCCSADKELLTFEQEENLTYARFHNLSSAETRLVNRVPLRNVPVGERLRLSLQARARGETQFGEAICALKVSFTLTDLVEADPYGEIQQRASSDEVCELILPVTGTWYELQEVILVPPCPPEKELHFECWCVKNSSTTVDVTSFVLSRGVL